MLVDSMKMHSWTRPFQICLNRYTSSSRELPYVYRFQRGRARLPIDDTNLEHGLDILFA
jgi:hypothetical protein